MNVEAKNFDTAAEFLKSFSEAPRLHLLYILYKRGAMNVTALQKETGYTQSIVSRHLQYLYLRRAVGVKKAGKERVYSINFENKPLYMLLPLIEVSWLQAG